jgi:hypothetical protein
MDNQYKYPHHRLWQLVAAPVPWEGDHGHEEKRILWIRVALANLQVHAEA